VRWLSRLVTVGIILTVVVAAGALIYANLPETQYGGTFRAFAMFRDGSRLQPGSPVVIAGVRIGDITRISIEGRLARVDMRMQDDIQIPVDSFATRRADSLFGDSYIEIIPGISDQYLRSGDQIGHVQEGGSTDTVLRAMARAMPKVDNSLRIVHEFMVNGRQWVQGPFENNLDAADQWLAAGHIEAPLSAAESALVRLEDATGTIAGAIADDGMTIPSRLDRWNRGVTSARETMADAKRELTEALANARTNLDRIDEPVQQVAEVVGAINNPEGDDWKGTLGRMVNDPQTGDDLDEATADLREATAGLDRFKSWLGARFELGAHSRVFRFYATAELRARNDKFYLVEVERSALGGLPADTLTDVANTNAYTRRQEIKDKLRFTFQFGKQIGFMQFRGGLKDSTFGVGADMLLMDGRLRLSTDVFGSFHPTPRVKLAGAFAVFRSVYILAGVDDVLNDSATLPVLADNAVVPEWFERVPHGRDYFVGAALHFTETDLATLLRFYGGLILGLALAD